MTARRSWRAGQVRRAKLDRLSLGDEGSAMAAKAAVEAANFRVEDVDVRPTRRNPSPPFTTSTLQQEAARKLGFSASHTMRVAQTLYEAGAITYMRTDGVQMDPSAIDAARRAISDRYNGHFLPEKPRIYETKAKNAQEAHEAIRPTDFTRDTHGSGDEARLYNLIWKRALASQMASAAIERTTVTLREGTGKHELRATGQVVKFPGFLAVYEEGRDQKPDADDDDSNLLPIMNKGDCPKKHGVDATQHFTQPPPRYSEASLVKRLEELGIGRPSTYAATLQVLKDRNYVRIEKNRFFAEESGRMLTAFLERFFDRYVAYEFTAGMEDELDDVSGGRAAWKQVLAEFWRDFKPKSDEVMEKKPSEVTAELDVFLEDYLFPRAPMARSARMPQVRQWPPVAARRPLWRVHRLLELSRVQVHPQVRPARRGRGRGGRGCAAGQGSGNRPGSHAPPAVRPLHPAWRRQGGQARLHPQGYSRTDLEWALKLLTCRAKWAASRNGKPITASIGRYGPYLAHDGKYARLKSTAEVFDTGMNAAVVRWPKRPAAPARAVRGRRPSRSRPSGASHVGRRNQADGGRYGPYVTDGTTNATLPRDKQPETLTSRKRSP
jgi:DNA topoisomerase-1